jgi:hypothetical protein
MGAAFALHSVLLKTQNLLESNYTNKKKHARANSWKRDICLSRKEVRRDRERPCNQLVSIKIGTTKVKSTGWASHLAAVASQ